MSVQAMTWVLEHSQAKLGARLVLLAIANHADGDGENSWASVARLSDAARLSERQTRAALRQLEDLGEIEDVGRSVRGTHIYRLPAMAAEPLPLGGAESAPAESAGGQNPPPGGQNRTERGAKSAPEPSLTVKRTVNTRPIRGRADVIRRSFAAWWEAYPRREGKVAAEAKFTRLVRAGLDPGMLIIAAERYAQQMARESRERRLIKLPLTWLNQGCWDDDYSDPKPTREAVDAEMAALAAESRS